MNNAIILYFFCFGVCVAITCHINKDNDDMRKNRVLAFVATIEMSLF